MNILAGWSQSNAEKDWLTDSCCGKDGARGLQRWQEAHEREHRGCEREKQTSVWVRCQFGRALRDNWCQSSAEEPVISQLCRPAECLKEQNWKETAIKSWERIMAQSRKSGLSKVSFRLYLSELIKRPPEWKLEGKRQTRWGTLIQYTQ